MSATTVPDALRGAAQHLRTYGWTRGQMHARLVRPKVQPFEPTRFVQDHVSTDVIEIERVPASEAPACTLGAISVAVGMADDSMLGRVDPEAARIHGLYKASAAAMERYLYKIGSPMNIPAWNDHLAPDAETVIRLLERAASAYEAEEAEARAKGQATMESMRGSVAGMVTHLVQISGASEALLEGLTKMQEVLAATPVFTPEPTPEVDAVSALEDAAQVVEAALAEAAAA